LTHWLEKAMEIQREFDQYFWHKEMGGYYNNGSDNSQTLLIRERSYIDNATPSANGVALTNLVRLGRVTENLDYLSQAEKGLKAFSAVLKQTPQACPSLFVALDSFSNGSLVRTTPEALNILTPQYHPTTSYRLEKQLPNDAIAIVCQGFSCLEPAKNMDQLFNQIQQFSLSVSNSE
jgi:hypothetical protein